MSDSWVFRMSCSTSFVVLVQVASFARVSVSSSLCCVALCLQVFLAWLSCTLSFTYCCRWSVSAPQDLCQHKCRNVQCFPRQSWRTGMLKTLACTANVGMFLRKVSCMLFSYSVRHFLRNKILICFAA